MEDEEEDDEEIVAMVMSFLAAMERGRETRWRRISFCTLFGASYQSSEVREEEQGEEVVEENVARKNKVTIHMMATTARVLVCILTGTPDSCRVRDFPNLRTYEVVFSLTRWGWAKRWSF